jgi:hypothetical protein
MHYFSNTEDRLAFVAASVGLDDLTISQPKSRESVGWD